MPRWIVHGLDFKEARSQSRISFPVEKVVNADTGQFVLSFSDCSKHSIVQVVAQAKELVDFIQHLLGEAASAPKDCRIARSITSGVASEAGDHLFIRDQRDGKG